MSIAEFVEMMQGVLDGMRPPDITTEETSPHGSILVDLTASDTVIEAQLDAWEAALQARATCRHEQQMIVTNTGQHVCPVCHRQML